MNRLTLLAGLLLTVAPASAQTQAEFNTTCATLGELTERALRLNRRIEALLYVRTAENIRSAMGNVNGCEAAYFARVVRENQQVFATATSVIAIDFVQPVPGWKHHDIEELLKLQERERFQDFFRRYRMNEGSQLDRLKGLDQDRVRSSP
ncbi:MAG: hypothetical protein ACJ8GN_04470 [Longimicrobiaceae bacterium]